MSTMETATINELIIEPRIITRTILYIHQYDIMGCYDRIIKGHTILNSRKFNILDNICKLHDSTHNKKCFKT